MSSTPSPKPNLPSALSSLADIEAVYTRLIHEHAPLAQLKVELPPLHTQLGELHTKGLQLVFLRFRMGKLVHKDEIADFVRSHLRGAARDQQTRHLKYMGWDLRLSGKANDVDASGKKIPNGYYLLDNVDRPNAKHAMEHAKRAGHLGAKDWEALKGVYKHCCAVCKEPGRALEKGHMDPSKPPLLENILPMCADCNNWASNRVIFGPNGRICALASPHLLLRSSRAVREEAYRALQLEFGSAAGNTAPL